MRPHFVISLDLEQAWGMEAAKAYGSARANIVGAREAIPHMLDLAERFGIGCTWATVGFLFFDDRDELLNALPAQRPHYADPGLSPYARMAAIGRNEAEDPLHFGRSLIRLIRDCPGQEIAGHTFSHYYSLEDGGDPAAFAADLAAARSAAAALGIDLRSLVFPRNQIRPAYLPLCHGSGYRSFRGNQRSNLHRSRPRHMEKGWSRLWRAADNYMPLAPRRMAKPSQYIDGMLNIAASRFLRPSSASARLLDRFQCKRICDEMTHAAKQGAVFHLWWHPHNFGRDIALNLKMLRVIFEHYHRLAGDHGMASITMQNLAALSSKEFTTAGQ